jgi:hypothetical protein
VLVPVARADGGRAPLAADPGLASLEAARAVFAAAASGERPGCVRLQHAAMRLALAGAVETN